jgi:hypothetical protein
MHPSNSDLVHAFPAVLRDGAVRAVAVFPENPRISQTFLVRMADEVLVLPYRIYHNPGLINTASLTSVEKELVDCLLTRHHDGIVREEHLRRIISRVAYLYSYAGVAHKTQARVRFLLDTMPHSDPDGLAGNEDCGQMSAWYIMSALGLYAVDPVSGNYVFGSPLFDRAAVQLAGGKQLIIETVGNKPDTPYIQSVTWNGKPYTKSWIRHADIDEGGTLIFQMSAQPNTAFGTETSDRPPSFV